MFAGATTLVHWSEQESLVVDITLIVGADGVSTAQKVDGRDLDPSPISENADTEISYEFPAVSPLYVYVYVSGETVSTRVVPSYIL